MFRIYDQTILLFITNASDVNADDKIAATTTPRFISTWSKLDDVQSLVLVVDGMVVDAQSEQKSHKDK